MEGGYFAGKLMVPGSLGRHQKIQSSAWSVDLEMGDGAEIGLAKAGRSMSTNRAKEGEVGQVALSVVHMGHTLAGKIRGCQARG